MAHQALFPHRHSNKTPAFHNELIELWHSNDPVALVLVFREGGKSTIAEEAFVIGAAFMLFNNAIIISSTEKRACERLRAIKHELERNEIVEALFGNLVGAVWNEAEVILANGVRITAVGRGQSLRGTKHLHYRPDFCFMDDAEDEENVRTPEARAETLSWFMSVVKPALDIDARIRVNATPLDREALPYRLQHELKWPTKIYPIEYIDGNGERRAMWPDRYPLSWIDKTKAEFWATGRMIEYQREFMCIAEDPATKIFTPEMMRVEASHVLTWQPVFAFVDPARTVKASSSTTGWAVWSFVGRKIVVWDGGGDHLAPDAIVKKVFDIEEEYRPVAIGVERDGLEEFLLQPLRAEAMRRGVVLPLVPMRAPKGKLDFIGGLQPHFKGGEVVFAKELVDLRAQFLAYPSGKIDGPNALAYAQLMRPEPVYDGFGYDHVGDNFSVSDRHPTWLAVNARGGYVTGVLVQYQQGRVVVVAEFVEEGDASRVESVIRAASLTAGVSFTLVAPPDHWDSYNTLGLRGAVARYPAELRRGARGDVGRAEIRRCLAVREKGLPLFRCALSARFTINAMAGGYSFEIRRDGTMSDEPRDGLYRCLVEGLESFTGMLKQASFADAGTPNYQYTPDGRRYISSLPGRAPLPAKDEWGPDAVTTSARTLVRH
jgi:hypothetical protein